MAHSQTEKNHCHGNGDKKKIDFFFWGCFVAVITLYGVQLFFGQAIQNISVLPTFSKSIFDLINTMWWGDRVGDDYSRASH